MRDIIFKGKSIYGDKWVCGNLIYHLNSRRYRIKSGGISFDVYQESICQYTEFKDKHGDYICEGDICHNIDGVFQVVWDETKGAFIIRFTDGDELYMEEMRDDTEIIGNIYNNKDMMGKSLGKWYWAEDGYLRCQNCNQKAPVVIQCDDEPMFSATDYCPYCGMDMR